MRLIQNAGLIFLASVITYVIFLIDLRTHNSLAAACLYIIVILYSWLLPGKYSTIYTAALCSALTIFSTFDIGEMDGNSKEELNKVNMLISQVVIWVSVTLVYIAKSSFTSLEHINKELSASSDILLEKVIKLDEQQEELFAHKNELERLNEELIIKNRELERFTSIASHDLQEPLRTIGNMTQLIEKNYATSFDDQGKKFLQYVTNATGRMTHLIKGLLEFSRIGNKREVQQVNCQELIETIVEDFEVALKAVNGTVMFKELPKVQGNPIELRMLFQNLISNAIKFKKKDEPPFISITSIESKEKVEFCITDNGIGIDEENYGKIFFIFQRLHPVEEYEGTGLGLAYCRKIVELHEGKIWVKSQKKVGTSFYFTLKKTV
ncbi:ATP-binding protein [Marivirga lumbricoides]